MSDKLRRESALCKCNVLHQLQILPAREVIFRRKVVPKRLDGLPVHVLHPLDAMQTNPGRQLAPLGLAPELEGLVAELILQPLAILALRTARDVAPAVGGAALQVLGVPQKLEHRGRAFSLRVRALEEDLEIGGREAGEPVAEGDTAGEGAEVVRGGDAEGVEDGGEDPQRRYLAREVDHRDEQVRLDFPRCGRQSRPPFQSCRIAAREVDECTSPKKVYEILVA